MTKPTDSKRQPACGALLSISEDFHQILRGNCPRCTTGVGACGVEVIRQALSAEEPAPVAIEESAEPAQLTRH